MRSDGAILLLLLILLSTSAVGASTSSLNLYVSRDGDDAWSGRGSAPNRGRTDGPFATLERARDAVRTLRHEGNQPDGGVTIWLRGGIYPREKTFTLTAEDSGAAGAPIIYRAYRAEEVRLIGGQEVRGWTPVRDPAVLARLAPEARGSVLQADLRAQGISDFGALARRGFSQAVVPAGIELFFQDQPMTLARWPNQGWAKITGAPAGQNGGRFTYEGDRPKRWAGSDDIWLHGYWTWDWADTYEKVRAIDLAKREIATVPPHGIYGYTPGKRYYALNILEELDVPGEWYLDRKSGLLYFWPPTSVEKGRAVVSLLDTPIIEMKEVSDVTLRGLTIECARSSGIVVEGGANNLIAGCTLRNLGTFAVSIGNAPESWQNALYDNTTLNRRGGANNGITGCDIYATGDGGILLGGGDRKTLSPGGNFAFNNEIHDYSRWSATYRPGIGMDGVGNRAAHNRIHDAPHNAILLSGNDHVIEYNEIFRVCRETGDAGAFYIGRDFTMRGNVVRYNYFHDMTRMAASGGGFVDVMSVYLDDCASGTTVYGNIFLRGGRAALIGGGRDNTFENNLFVDCSPSIHVDGRGTGWAKSWFNGEDSTLMDRLKAVNYSRPPYSTRYPHLLNILEDEAAKPKYNRIVRNIRVGGKWIEWYDGLSDKTVEVKDNLTDGDGGLVAPESGDFRFKPNSPARKLGIKPVPQERIGLIRDKYRTRL